MSKEIALFAQCGEGCWHLIQESTYDSLDVEINVYVSKDAVKVSLDCNPARQYGFDPYKLEGIDYNPLAVLLRNSKFAESLQEHINSRRSIPKFDYEQFK